MPAMTRAGGGQGGGGTIPRHGDDACVSVHLSGDSSYSFTSPPPGGRPTRALVGCNPPPRVPLSHSAMSRRIQWYYVAPLGRRPTRSERHTRARRATRTETARPPCAVPLSPLSRVVIAQLPPALDSTRTRGLTHTARSLADMTCLRAKHAPRGRAFPLSHSSRQACPRAGGSRSGKPWLDPTTKEPSLVPGVHPTKRNCVTTPMRASRWPRCHGYGTHCLPAVPRALPSTLA